MPDKKASSNRIPIRYPDSEEESEITSRSNPEDFAGAQDEQDDPLDEDGSALPAPEKDAADSLPFEDDAALFPSVQRGSGELGGPLVAELVATRAELKRVEGEVADLKDRLARRQADFENYRKRVERERSETYERVVAEIAAKLLPVLDNLKRALDTEASMEAGESDEFRHFLSGVDLIFKQLSGVIEALGVKPVLSVGERFDPHIHEAVVSEASDEHEPDTVMEEIIRGYRMGDKLIRPALVKVATKK
ncbi:MAG TPA: nucleotide exchange factor GrpE [Pyrinomonadaceae bacterium]|nr:nucleotide exchange factor GrpE [Pyrinomonadaceae bacterium]